MKIYYDFVDTNRLEGLKTFTEDGVLVRRNAFSKPMVGWGDLISSEKIADSPFYEHKYKTTLNYVVTGEEGIMQLLKDSDYVITEEEGKLWLRYHDDY